MLLYKCWRMCIAPSEATQAKGDCLCMFVCQCHRVHQSKQNRTLLSKELMYERDIPEFHPSCWTHTHVIPSSLRQLGAWCTHAALRCCRDSAVLSDRWPRTVWVGALENLVVRTFCLWPCVCTCFGEILKELVNVLGLLQPSCSETERIHSSSPNLQSADSKCVWTRKMWYPMMHLVWVF